MHYTLSAMFPTASTYDYPCIFYEDCYHNSEKPSKPSKDLIKLVIMMHLAIFYKGIILEKGGEYFFLKKGYDL